jgi:gamma-glutamyltranspeptidase / glutathione hydrolase
MKLLLQLALSTSVIHFAESSASSCCASLSANPNSPLDNCGGSRSTGAQFATRSPVLSRRGQVASAHPLASQAGLDILKAGGSAVDAALATNLVLSVLEPMMNGPGGDLMVIISLPNNTVQGYNGAGRSSKTFSYSQMQAELASLGLSDIAGEGPLSVTVPGAPQGWCDLHARYGKLPFADVFAPAIYYAENGAPVPQIIANEWSRFSNNSQITSGGLYPHALDGWEQVFGGLNGIEGSIFKNTALANTLRLIAADSTCASFYKSGPIPDALIALGETAGLKLTADDLASHHGEWVDPIKTSFQGTSVFELPPNPQGAAALEMLNIIELYNFTSLDFNSPDWLHVHLEAKKLAFADASAFFADPDFATIPLDGIISKEYAITQATRINMSNAAKTDSPGQPQFYKPSGAKNSMHPTLESRYGGDTTYLTTSDSDGMQVSWIQSLYEGFGSGIVSPTLGFALQSRGSLFAMVPGHPNVYAPNKRPFHTIAPALASKQDGSWTLSFGVMGGFMQPQGHAQILSNLLLGGMNLQEAGDSARYYHTGSTAPNSPNNRMSDGGLVELEAGVCDQTIAELEKRGHTISRGSNGGGYQAILKTFDPVDGGIVYTGASEMRKDGQVAAY